MFVTCLYAILDPRSGRLHFANAGHDLPYRHRSDGVDELRARGMPLGLMPGMSYEENELTLAPGEGVLLYSDGLVEAHNPQRAMFSFGRLQSLLASPSQRGEALVGLLLDELARFTGEGWEQEDDITMVLVGRETTAEDGGWRMEDEGSQASAHPSSIFHPPSSSEEPVVDRQMVAVDEEQRVLAEWTLPSEPGNERVAMERVGEAVAELGLPARRLERLKTAVAEATMNAIEHGNRNQPELPVEIRVQTSASEVIVEIVDQGGDKPIVESETPDLYAKLEGEQSPRGWGLFLIKSMVDDMRVESDERHHRIELIMHRENQEPRTENL
jgi:anti-sigma regulatory factor (Ser/Thr protein kinase)